MQLTNDPEKHLTYCTNIHPGESWDEVFAQLKKAVPELKSRIVPSDSFGIGLRLSARAASALLKGERLPAFKKWLEHNGLYVFTMNGFPYGDFHSKQIKEEVYAPDWRREERINYTLDLVKILAYLLPEGMDGSISTSPLSYKYWLKESSQREEVFQQGSRNMAQIAYVMAQIEANQGKELHLAIEPEPDCLLENSRETVDYFQQWLFPEGSAYLSKVFGINLTEAARMLKKHIGVCYDTCHFAVEYEDPLQAIERFTQAGIRIGKVQLSAALKCMLETSDMRREASSRLKAFEESTYLHQVIERQQDGSFHYYPDLSEALPHIVKPEAKEWRIHYHVPVFIDRFDSLRSTRSDITQSWKVLKEVEGCHHFEIETYTWEVLPEALKQDLIDSIEREFRWTLAMMKQNE
jgi:sugar phosphate isomerase/epimerase